MKCEQVTEGEVVHLHVQLPAMKPVLNSQQKQLSLVFSALRENRLHVTLRRDNVNGDIMPQPGDVIGQVMVVKADSLAPVCVLNFPVPAAEPGDVNKPGREVDEIIIQRVLKKKEKKKSSEDNGDDDVSRAELRLTDVAEMVHDDWKTLASQLDVSAADVDNIVAQYSYASEQVRVTSEQLQQELPYHCRVIIIMCHLLM